MKKLFLFLMFIPFIVLAKGNDDVYIDSISLIEKSDNVIEKEQASIDELKIGINISMSDVGDSIKYKVVLKNDSNIDYEISYSSKNNETDYFKYDLVSKDDSFVVKAKSSKEFELTIKYDKAILNKDFSDGIFKENQTMLIDLSNKGVNPNTKAINILIISILLLISLILFLYFYKKYKKIEILSLIFLLLIPFAVKAYNKLEVILNCQIEVRKEMVKECTYDGPLEVGAVYRDGNFLYHYRQHDTSIFEGGWEDFPEDYEDGWGFIYLGGYNSWNGENYDDTIETNSVCTTINGKPIVSAFGAFVDANLDIIDFSTFDTSHIVDMTAMFSSAEATKEIDFSGFDTSNTKDMYLLFEDAKIPRIDLSTWDTSNATVLMDMFARTETNYLDVSSFTFNNASYLSAMFSGIKIPELDLSSWDTSNILGMREMFSGVEMDDLNISNFNWKSISGDEYDGIYRMFANAKFNTLTLGEVNLDKAEYFNGVFSDSEIHSLDVESINIPKVKFMDGTFYNATIDNLDMSKFTNANSLNTMRSTFHSYRGDTINFIGFDTPNLSSLDSTFQEAQLETLDLSALDTSSVTSMFSTFKESKIKNLKINSSNKLTSTLRMFEGAEIDELDLSEFDTSNVTNMNYMFSRIKIPVLNLESFTLNSSVNMGYMFNSCEIEEGYAKDQASANKYNSVGTTKIPDSVRFIVRQ